MGIDLVIKYRFHGGNNMALDYKFDIKLAVENALYEHATDDMRLKEIEEIREIVNKTIDDFIKDNNIK